MAARHTRIGTTLGELTLVAEADALTGLYFPQHRYPPSQEALGSDVDPDGDPLFAHAAAQLGEYLAGDRTRFDLPVTTTGDPFQERVWRLLQEIPFGATTTYGELADQLGNRSLAQRVGQAVGRNPVSVVIPCHRVVGKHGSLTGYAGGLRRKQRLLELEEPAEVRAGRLL